MILNDVEDCIIKVTKIDKVTRLAAGMALFRSIKQILPEATVRSSIIS